MVVAGKNDATIVQNREVWCTPRLPTPFSKKNYQNIEYEINLTICNESKLVEVTWLGF